MFIEKQIITDAAERELPLYVRTMLWYMLERRDERHAELHSFELDAAIDEEGRCTQTIVHTCTIPTYQNEHQYTDEAPIKTSVVIRIEELSSSIMMLADELDKS